MQKNNETPHSLKISLHGLTKQMQKMMISYLETNCKGIAHVVEENESDAEIVNVDLTRSKSLLTERLAQQPSKPIIALSSQKVSIDNVIYVKKPIDVANVVNALKKAKKNLLSNKNSSFKKNNKEKATSHPTLDPKSKKNSKNKKPSSFSISILEIDTLLKELQSSFKKVLSPEKNNTLSEKNDRKTIRYAFKPFEATLNKKYLTKNKNFTVLIVNLSSRGSLIELQSPSKLRGKVTLNIQFDSQHIFEIHAKVVRANDDLSYGLQFLNNQHKLVDYLINTGHSFIFS